MRINLRYFLWAPLSILLLGFPVVSRAGDRQAMPEKSGKNQAPIVSVDEHGHGGHERGEHGHGRWDRGDRWRGGDRDWDRGRWGYRGRDWDDYYGRRYYYGPSYGYYGTPYYGSPYYNYGYQPYGYAYPYSYRYPRGNSFFGFLNLW